jgi:hypothetical protein
MKLSNLAIGKINTPTVRRELSGLLKVTEQSIIRYIHTNEINGPLTRMAVLCTIKNMTELGMEDILQVS